MDNLIIVKLMRTLQIKPMNDKLLMSLIATNIPQINSHFASKMLHIKPTIWKPPGHQSPYNSISSLPHQIEYPLKPQWTHRNRAPQPPTCQSYFAKSNKAYEPYNAQLKESQTHYADIFFNDLAQPQYDKVHHK